ncbi:SNARE associated Golgi protein-like protein [Thalassoporum mexicanum PCC 7367]|nr:DedA family protein [Pseudanabaena sp. PCC 7367]AFY71158.1 SNARE associated Golgi protein-like protein [Pseudanabaena sp. PCC 7367]
MSLELFTLAEIKDLAQQYGYWVVFFGIMLENAGIPLPGETITLVGGFLAGSGELLFANVLVAAIGGAVVGDNFGYWLGRWGGDGFLEWVGKLFKLDPAEIDKAKDRFSGNSDRAVFFGRFIALLRIFAGPLAGLSGMSYPRFLFFNAAGAIAWGTTMTSLAYFAGSFIPLERLVNYVLKFGLSALAIVLAWFAIPPAIEWWKLRSGASSSSEPNLEPTNLDQPNQPENVVAEELGNEASEVEV